VTKKAVFLITIDDVRSDHTSMEDWKRDTTPFLEKFSEEGEYLENHYSVGPSSPTSFRSTLSSTTPISFLDYDQLSGERPYLPEKLSENGVYTVGLTTNPYVSSYFGFDRGFDEFLDFSNPDTQITFGESKGVITRFREILSSSELIRGAYNRLRKLKRYEYPYLSAEKVVDEFKEFVNSNNFEGKENIFFWVHFMDAHEPFIPPKETIGTWSDYENPWDLREDFSEIREMEDWQQISKFYDECILDLDSKLELLVEFIEENFSEREVSIILVSDHGELIGEKDMLHHAEILEKEVFSVPAVFKSERELNLDGVTTNLDMQGITLTKNNPPNERFVEACLDGEERWRKDPEGYSAGIVDKNGFVSKFRIGKDNLEDVHSKIKEKIPSTVKLWID
jgi:uncharacterized sulfatase